jgi:hypothetical protein
MTQPISLHPAHRYLWSGLSSDDGDAEVGVLGIPFNNAAITSFAAAKVIYEVFGWVKASQS